MIYKYKNYYLISGILFLVINKTIDNEKTLIKLIILILGALLVIIGIYQRFNERK